MDVGIELHGKIGRVNLSKSLYIPYLKHYALSWHSHKSKNKWYQRLDRKNSASIHLTNPATTKVIKVSRKYVVDLWTL